MPQNQKIKIEHINTNQINHKERKQYMSNKTNTSNTKTIDILRKRNTQMQEELDRLKTLYKDYEQIKHLNEEYEKHDPNFGERRVAGLIGELEGIRKEWMDVLEDLNRERDEYRDLIEDMRGIRGVFGQLE